MLRADENLSKKGIVLKDIMVGDEAAKVREFLECTYVTMIFFVIFFDSFLVWIASSNKKQKVANLRSFLKICFVVSKRTKRNSNRKNKYITRKRNINEYNVIDIH